jgi:hypothetical protein
MKTPRLSISSAGVKLQAAVTATATEKLASPDDRPERKEFPATRAME